MSTPRKILPSACHGACSHLACSILTFGGRAHRGWAGRKGFMLSWNSQGSVLPFQKIIFKSTSYALNFDEIHSAQIICLRQAQGYFNEERNLLLANKSPRSRFQLLKFSPITWKERRRCNHRKSKGNKCLFVCLVTSGIHVISAQMSWMSRMSSWFYGTSREMLPNFVVAKRVLDEMLDLFQSQHHKHTVAQSSPNDGLKKRLKPPHSPHGEGKWESEYARTNCIFVLS